MILLHLTLKFLFLFSFHSFFVAQMTDSLKLVTESYTARNEWQLSVTFDCVYYNLQPIKFFISQIIGAISFHRVSIIQNRNKIFHLLIYYYSIFLYNKQQLLHMCKETKKIKCFLNN